MINGLPTQHNGTVTSYGPKNNITDYTINCYTNMDMFSVINVKTKNWTLEKNFKE